MSRDPRYTDRNRGPEAEEELDFDNDDTTDDDEPARWTDDEG